VSQVVFLVLLRLEQTPAFTFIAGLKGDVSCASAGFETTLRASPKTFDFTVGPGDLEIPALQMLLRESRIGLARRGICLVIILDSASFRPRKKNRCHPRFINGRIAYHGPLASPAPPM